jgi:hypothetical protein
VVVASDRSQRTVGDFARGGGVALDWDQSFWSIPTDGILVWVSIVSADINGVLEPAELTRDSRLSAPRGFRSADAYRFMADQDPPINPAVVEVNANGANPYYSAGLAERVCERLVELEYRLFRYGNDFHVEARYEVPFPNYVQWLQEFKDLERDMEGPTVRIPINGAAPRMMYAMAGSIPPDGGVPKHLLREHSA